MRQVQGAKKEYVNPNTGTKGKEEIDVLSDGDPEEVKLPPVEDEARSQLVADATVGHDQTSGPDVKRYLVVKGNTVLVNGMRTLIKEGKIIDSRNYDIKNLQRQGIRLERHTEEEVEYVE